MNRWSPKVDQLLELLQGVGANLLLGDHALDLGAIAGGQLHEAQAARVAQEQHTAGDADHVLGLVARFELAVILGADLFDGGGDVKGHRVRLDAFLKHHGALGHTHLHLFRVGQRADSLLDGSTASSSAAPPLILARIAASCCSSISARSTVVMVGTAASSSF